MTSRQVLIQFLPGEMCPLQEKQEDLPCERNSLAEMNTCLLPPPPPLPKFGPGRKKGSGQHPPPLLRTWLGKQDGGFVLLLPSPPRLVQKVMGAVGKAPYLLSTLGFLVLGWGLPCSSLLRKYLKPERLGTTPRKVLSAVAVSSVDLESAAQLGSTGGI